MKLAQKRMQLEGRQNRQPYTKAKLKKIFGSWHIYMLTLVYMCDPLHFRQLVLNEGMADVVIR